MTGAPISELGNTFFCTRSTNGTSSNTESGNFEKEMNKLNLQGRDTNQTETKQDNSKLPKGTEPVSKRDSVQTGKERKELKQPNDVKEKEPGELVDSNPSEGKDLLKAVEEVTEELMAEISQLLGITTEQLQELMIKMEIPTTDLLSQGVTDRIVLQVNQCEDVMQFATDEGMYLQSKEVKETVLDVINSLTEEFPISKEELDDFLTTVKQTAATEKENSNAIITAETFNMSQTSEAQENPENVTTDQEMTVQVNQIKPVQTEQNSNDNSEHREERNDSELGQKTGSIQNQIVFSTENGTETIQVIREASGNSETESIMKQITEYIKVNVKPETSEVQMKLTPENLGTLHIQLLSKSGNISAHFSAENETVKAAIESQMVQLKENFEQQGMKVEAIEVTVGTPEFSQSNEQNAGYRQEAQKAKKSSVRRINLNDPDSLSELTGDDNLEVEMMKASGSTVDYMA